jgi:hypothetical protein
MVLAILWLCFFVSPDFAPMNSKQCLQVEKSCHDVTDKKAFLFMCFASALEKSIAQRLNETD